MRTTSTGLTVPAFFALGANDPVVDNDNVIAQVANQKTRGILTECTIEPETDLTTARLLRVSGIDNAKANTIFSAFVGAGLVYAGITDRCGMAMLLGKLPYNRRGPDGVGGTCAAPVGTATPGAPGAAAEGTCAAPLGSSRR